MCLGIFLGIKAPCFNSPAPPKPRVLGAHPCPAVVTTRSDDALFFSRIGESMRPTEAVAALWPPSDSWESSSQGTGETHAGLDPTASTPAAAGPRPAANPSLRSAGGAAGAAERAWARRP